MTLTLNPDTEARLRAAAARRGLTPEAAVDALLAEDEGMKENPRHSATAPTTAELGWSPGFFERTAGAWQGEPLERSAQGEHQEREPLL